jgi:hypothetical protein
LPPSTDSGGSLPSSTISARFKRCAPRDRVWSKLAVPCALIEDGRRNQNAGTAGRPLNQRCHDAGRLLARQ